jgi:putative inorganic carbon (hco3(-)) transporter
MVQLARAMIRWELLFLLFLAPFLFFPGSGRHVAIVALPLLWVVRWIAHRRFIPRTPADGSLLLLLLMVVVSLWATFDVGLSLPKVTGVLLGVAIYYALVEQANNRRGMLFSVFLLIMVTSLMAAVGLFTTNWAAKFPAFAPLISRLPAYVLALPASPPEGFNPNGIAGAILFALPLLTLLAWPRRNRTISLFPVRFASLWYLFALLLFLLVAGTLILTQSRGGYLGGLVGGLALFVLPKRRLRWFMLAMLLVISFVWFGVGSETPTPSVAASEASVTDALDTLEGRVEIWSRALYIIQDFPFTGIGMGTFRRLVPLLYPLFTLPATRDIGHPHNHLLAAGVDLGLVGLVAYLSLWMVSGLMLWQVWRQSVLESDRMLSLGLAAGMLGQFVWAMTDANTLGTKAGFPFWLALAAVAALHRTSTSASHLQADRVTDASGRGRQ